MPTLKPAYLIHGDDHGAIAERRAGLRALAEAQAGGAGSVELLDGEAATPAAAARALATMTLAIGGTEMGRRVILVEGVERWRERDVEEHLAAAMGEMPPDTTLALFAREDGRSKAPAALQRAVQRAGGQVVAQTTVKPWQLPGWVREQGARLGLALDSAAAKALVDQVGERQQRLLRELEKLALGGARAGSAGGGRGDAVVHVSADEIYRGASHSAQWRAYSLADALLAGEGGEAILSYLRLRQQGERLPGLTSMIAQRLREALQVALRLRAGDPPAEIRRALRMPVRAAERLVAEAARSDPDRLRRALCTLADLELDSRGGAPPGHGRSALAELQEDTLALRAIETIGA